MIYVIFYYVHNVIILDIYFKHGKSSKICMPINSRLFCKLLRLLLMFFHVLFALSSLILPFGFQLEYVRMCLRSRIRKE